MEAKLKRNKDIYEQRLSGKNFAEIGEQYDVTSNRARVIFENEKRKEKLKQHRYYNVLVSLTDNEEMQERLLF